MSLVKPLFLGGSVSTAFLKGLPLPSLGFAGVNLGLSSKTLIIQNDDFTAILDGGYTFASQTLTSDAAFNTVFGILISHLPSAVVTVSNINTLSLTANLKTPSHFSQELPEIITVKLNTFKVETGGEYVTETQILLSGVAIATISDNPTPLAPPDTFPTTNSSTVTIRPESYYQTQVTPQFLLGGQTLIPGGPALTVSGTPVSLTPGESFVVMGTNTMALTAAQRLAVGSSSVSSIGSSILGNGNSGSIVAASFTGATGRLLRGKFLWSLCTVGVLDAAFFL